MVNDSINGKNASDFITLSVFFITISLQNVYSFYFIHVRSNSR